MQILTRVSEEEQAELLVNIEAQGFAGLVHYTKIVSWCYLSMYMQLLLITQLHFSSSLNLAHKLPETLNLV